MLGCYSFSYYLCTRYENEYRLEKTKTMFGNNNNRKQKDGRLGKLLFAMVLMSVTTISAQTSFSKATKIYLMHSSSNHLERGSNDGGIIVAATKSNPQQMTFIPDGKGYYSIQSGTAAKFLSLSGQWNTTFVADSSQAAAKFAIESSNNYVKLRCKANNKYLGTDKNDSGSSVYADKSGSDIKHLWYFSDKVNALPPVDTPRYIVSPQVGASISMAGAYRSAGGLVSAASGATRRLTRL